MTMSRWSVSCLALALLTGSLGALPAPGAEYETQVGCPWIGSEVEIIGPATISLPPSGDAPILDPAYEVIPLADPEAGLIVIVSVRRTGGGLLEPLPLDGVAPYRIIDCYPGEPGAQPEYWVAVMEDAPLIGLPNPASGYCIQRGGELEFREEPAGTAGYCRFSNGTACEEWAFFEGSCGLPIRPMHERVEWVLQGIDCDTLTMWGFTSEMTAVSDGVYSNSTEPIPRPTGFAGNWQEWEGESWSDTWDIDSRMLSEEDISGFLPEYLPYGINLSGGRRVELNGWMYTVQDRFGWRRIQTGRTYESRYGWRLTNAEDLIEDFGGGAYALTPVGELSAVYDEKTGLMVDVWMPQQLYDGSTFLADRYKEITATFPQFEGTQPVVTRIDPQTCGAPAPEPGTFAITLPTDGDMLVSDGPGFSSVTLGWDDAPADVSLEGYQVLIQYGGRQIVDEMVAGPSYDLVPFDDLATLPQGNYRVEVRVHDVFPLGGEYVPYRDSIEFEIVNPPSFSDGTGFVPAEPACPDDAMTFTASASDPDGDPLTYRWFIDGEHAAALDGLAAWTWKDDPATAVELDWNETVSVEVADNHGAVVSREFAPPPRTRLSNTLVTTAVDGPTVTFTAYLDGNPREGIEILIDGSPWKGGALTSSEGSLALDMTGSSSVAGDHSWSAVSCGRELDSGTFTIEPPIEMCFDGLDNDFDGDTDANDLDCALSVEVETFIGNAPAGSPYQYLLGFVVSNPDGPVAGAQMKLATDPDTTDPAAFTDCGPLSDSSGFVACGWNASLPSDGFAWRATSTVGTMWFGTLTPQVVDLSAVLTGVGGDVTIDGRHGTTTAGAAPGRETILGDGRYLWSGGGQEGYLVVENGLAIAAELHGMDTTTFEGTQYVIQAVTPSTDPCAADGSSCWWDYLDRAKTYGVILTALNDDGSLGSDVWDLSLAFEVYTAWKLQQGFFGSGAYHWERQFGFDAVLDDNGDPVLDSSGDPTYESSYPLLTARRKAILDAMSNYIEGRKLEHGISLDLKLFKISVTTIDDIYDLICDMVYNCGFNQKTSDQLFLDSTIGLSKDVGKEVVKTEGKRALAKWLQTETRRGVAATAAKKIVGDPKKALKAAKVKPSDVITPASIAKTLAAYAIGHFLQMSDFSYFADMLWISANDASNYAETALPAGSLSTASVRDETYANLYGAFKSLQEHYLYSKSFWQFANDHWLSYDPSGTYIDAPGKLEEAEKNYNTVLEWLAEFEREFYLVPLEELAGGKGWLQLAQPATVATAYSPVHLHLYDSSGRHCGPLPSGSVECSVPGAAHSGSFTEPQTITVFGPGTYQFEIQAVAGGTFGLDIAADLDTGPQLVAFREVLVETQSVGSVEVTVGGSVPDLRLDADGDGTFETRIPATVTSLLPIVAAEAGPPWALWIGTGLLASILIGASVAWWRRRSKPEAPGGGHLESEPTAGHIASTPP